MRFNPRSQQTVSHITEMTLAGWSQRRIQAALGVSAETVVKIRKQHCLKKPIDAKRRRNKLTPEQRHNIVASLLSEPKFSEGSTSPTSYRGIAKRFGICHTTVQYWASKIGDMSRGR